MPPPIFDREDLPFPGSLPEFQRLFPNDAACAAYLEAIRWRQGFVCMWCGERGEPFRFANRPHVLRCRKCRKDNRLTAGTIMQDTHTRLSVWFWGAYLASSLTPGLSAVQFQRQLGIGRYETAFQILHKLRAGMVRPERKWQSFKEALGMTKPGPKPQPIDMVSKNRHTPRLLTPEQETEIAERKARGETQTAIALSLGISQALVSLTLRKRIAA